MEGETDREEAAFNNSKREFLGQRMEAEPQRDEEKGGAFEDHVQAQDFSLVPTGWHWRYDVLARMFIVVSNFGLVALTLLYIEVALVMLGLLYVYLALDAFFLVVNPPKQRGRSNCKLQRPVQPKTDGNLHKANFGDEIETPSGVGELWTPKCGSNCGTGTHLVLVSHYKEDQWILQRLIDSIGQSANQTSWPVRVVIAAEAKSNLVMEGWEDNIVHHDLASLHVVVHALDKETERQGLGSNLRNAMKHVFETEEVISKDKETRDRCMVTKLDGSCCLNEDFLLHLEQEWTRFCMECGVAFQPFVREIDHNFEEYDTMSIFARSVNGVRITDPVGTHVLVNSHFHCSYCIPLQAIDSAGNWDPWLVQEDILMAVRLQLGRPTEPMRIRMLRSIVYNAPALTLRDYWTQQRRCGRHSMFVVGYCLGNLHKIRSCRQALSLGSTVIFIASAFFHFYGLGCAVSISLNSHHLSHVNYLEWIVLLMTGAVTVFFGVVVGIVMAEHLGKKRSIGAVLWVGFCASLGLQFRLLILGMSSTLMLFGSRENSLDFVTTPTLTLDLEGGGKSDRQS